MVRMFLEIQKPSVAAQDNLQRQFSDVFQHLLVTADSRKEEPRDITQVFESSQRDLIDPGASEPVARPCPGRKIILKTASPDRL